MPASEVMHLYRQHKLHSGPGGPVVKSKKQATAIQISMARKEGHHIPKVKGSFQGGGLVPETGAYKLHQGEEVRKQFEDIARRTRGAEEAEWRAARQNPRSPYDLRSGAPPESTSAHYAVEGLKGNVAQRMREQGERAAGLRTNFDTGGPVQQTGDYKVQAGEQLVPNNFYAAANRQNFSWPVRDIDVGEGPNISTRPTNPIYAGATRYGFSYPVRDTATGAAPDIGTSAPGAAPALGAAEAGPAKPGLWQRFKERLHKGKKEDGGIGNPQLDQMNAAVGSPLNRTYADSFKRGGTIPRTGIYRLHKGEHVIPKSLAGRYREMKAHG
jgi:hypothetical protein